MRKLQTQGMHHITLTGADVAPTVNWRSRKKKAEHKARPKSNREVEDDEQLSIIAFNC